MGFRIRFNLPTWNQKFMLQSHLLFIRYQQLLTDIHQCYLDQRELLLGPSITCTVNSISQPRRSGSWRSFLRESFPRGVADLEDPTHRGRQKHKVPAFTLCLLSSHPNLTTSKIKLILITALFFSPVVCVLAPRVPVDSLLSELKP